MIVGVSDKLVVPWLKGKKYLDVSDEGEAVGVGIGYFLSTGKRATVFMSADGFCNALNPITSMVIPDKIEMDIVISVGRKEPQHIVMSEILESIIALLKYDPKKLSFRYLKKE